MGLRLRFVTLLRGIALGLLVIAMAACSGDDDDTSDAPEAVSAIAALPGEEELRGGLLTVDDFPTGWAEVDAGSDDDDPLCGIKLTELLEIDGDLPSAEAVFAADEDTGPLVFEELGFVPEGRGKEAVDAAKVALDACEGDNVDGGTATLSPLSFPDIGEQSIAYRLRVERDDTSVEFDLVYAREGDLLIVIAAVDFFGDATAVLEEFAPVAMQKAADALL